jgi:hypothetical protein
MKRFILLIALILQSVLVFAQSFSYKSNEFAVDSKNIQKESSIAFITWSSPVQDVNFVFDNRFLLKFEVKSSTELKSITVSVKKSEKENPYASRVIELEEGENKFYKYEGNLNLTEGENIIEVSVENIDSVKSFSQKKIKLGSDALENVNSLGRTDYALLIATDKYDNWGNLVNPIYDSKTIAKYLEETFGYKVTILENPTQQDILRKLKEFAELKFNPLDQLFIFFAGHGSYDQTFGEGYVVLKESLIDDDARSSYLSYNRLRSIINNIPCEHIFLVMDVCYGGTFDELLASTRGENESVYKESNLGEFIVRKMANKTRRYLTSGGKTYVSDGIPGMHSPFARAFIEALKSRGGNDGILTVAELYSFVEKLKIQPRAGEFGNNENGSDFLFIVK